MPDLHDETPSDKRGDPRVPVLRSGEVILGEGPLASTRAVSFVDVSATGCQILLINPPEAPEPDWPVDGICHLRLTLAGRPPMDLPAKVVWTQACGEDGLLAGFQFCGKETPATHELRTFVGHRIRAGLERQPPTDNTPAANDRPET